MTVVASLQFTQGVTTAPPSMAMFGVAGTPVTVAQAGNVAQFSDFIFTVVDAPPSSSYQPGRILSSGTSPVCSFTPDTTDTFLIQLQTTDLQGNITQDLRAFAVKRTSGLYIPAFSAPASALNFSGNARGYAPAMEAWLDAIQTSNYTLAYFVDAYGADPTGSTDSTAAINTVLGLIAAAGGTSATVQYGPGTYKTTGIQLLVNSHSGIRFAGASPGSNSGFTKTIIKLAGAAGSVLSVQGKQISFRDIWFHGGNLAQAGTVQLQYLTNFCRFERCLFSHTAATPLTGLFAVNHLSQSVTATISQIGKLKIGSPILFANDPTSTFYWIQTIDSTGLNLTISAQYQAGNSTSTAVRPNPNIDIPRTPLLGNFTVSHGSGTATTTSSQVGVLQPNFTVYFATDPNTTYTVQTVSAGNITFLPTYVPSGTGVVTQATCPLEVDSVVFDDCQIDDDPSAGVTLSGFGVHTDNLNASHILFQNCYFQNAYWAVWNDSGGISVKDSEGYNFTAGLYAFSNAAFSSTLDNFYTEGGSLPYLYELNTTTNPTSTYNVLTVRSFSAFTDGNLGTGQLLCKQPIIIDGGVSIGNWHVTPDPTAGIYAPTFRNVSFFNNPSKGVTGSLPGPAGIIGAQYCDIDNCTCPAVGINGAAAVGGPFAGALTYSMRHDGPLNALAFGCVNDAITVFDAVINIGTPTTLSSATMNAQQTWVGRDVYVAGAGPGPSRLAAAILAVAPGGGSVTLGTAASNGVTAARCDIGTECFTALSNFATAAAAAGRTAHFPSPGIGLSGGWIISNGALSMGEISFGDGSIWVMPEGAFPTVGKVIFPPSGGQCFSNYAQGGTSGTTQGGYVTISAATPVVPCEAFGTSATIPEVQLQAPNSVITYRNTLTQRVHAVSTWSGSNDNITCPTQEFSEILAPASDFEFSGIAPPLGTAWTPGMDFHFWVNGNGSHNFTITNNATSTAGYRLFCATGANIVKPLTSTSRCYVHLRYLANAGGTGVAGFAVLEPAA